MTATTEQLIWLVGQRTRFHLGLDALTLTAANGWTLKIFTDRRIRHAPDTTPWTDRIEDIEDKGSWLAIFTDGGAIIEVDLSDSDDPDVEAMVLTGPGGEIMVW